ncbi:MAG: LamG domain-containing protein, partial [Planctomycetota bacterium]
MVKGLDVTENYEVLTYGDGHFHFPIGHADGSRTMGNTAAGVAVTNEWAHFTYTYDPAEGRRFYKDGSLIFEDTESGTPQTSTDPLIIGNEGGMSRFVNGTMDDVRIYNHVLTEVEILAAMEGEGYPYALGADPEDGALLAATWVNLSWSAGSFAVSHNVYLGDNFDDVNDGTGDTFRGNLELTTTSLIAGFTGFPFPDGLVPGTTYYWRVDEVNDADPNSPWKGNVWSFRIPPKKAYEPSVADGAKFVTMDVELSWTAGFGAKLHHVYFGDDLDTVTNATGGAVLSDPTFSPGALETDKTYYWRADEFEAPMTHTGDVWSFTTVPDIAVTDPDLMGWWTFDEGQDATVVDWSGHGNHGRVEVEGDPLWVDGYQVAAMDMAGITSVQIPAESWSTIENQATLTMWTYGDPAGVPNTFNFGAFAGGSRVFSAHVPWGGNVYFDSGRTPGQSPEYDRIFRAASPSEYRGNWRHWTFVKNAETGTKEIYLDGELWYGETGWNGVMTGVTEFTLGSHPNGSNPYKGIMDDVRLYSKALTPEEIAVVMLGNTKLAGSPVPDRNTLVDIRDISSLSWSAGDTAASHDVYLGTDRDAVALADNTAAEFQGNQAGTSLSLATLVEFGGGDYYWRIDEVEAGGTVVAGTVWKFTVPDYLIVDDFESYNDIEEGQEGSNRIYLTWIDGYGTATNGSQAGNLDPPFMSQGRSSAQAMPLLYDNAGKTSEATRTLVDNKDWTVHGVTKLVVWFRGDSANAAERMFVALGNATVYHPDDAATQDTGWNEWVIDLTEFA